MMITTLASLQLKLIICLTISELAREPYYTLSEHA